MELRDRIECQVAPATVLLLIRDGQATSIAELIEVLKVSCSFGTDLISGRARVYQVVEDLADAGLIRKEEGKLAPTPLVATVQAALGISLKELSETQKRGQSELFVAASVLDELRGSKNDKFDLAKVVRFCEELNSSYAAGNYLASILLIRALINHVPPVYGQKSFGQVVSQAGKSLKELLKPLEEIARDVGDLHTHSMIQRKESLPTKHQVQPFKANLEVLLQDIIARVNAPLAIPLPRAEELQ
jgi:hypothetical protein